MKDELLSSIYDLTLENFQQYFPKIPSFRFTQIRLLRSKGYDNLDDYKIIGKDTEKNLFQKLRYSLFSSRVVDISEDDTACKIIVQLSDGKEVECVYIKSNDKPTVCISSQIGCRCGCKFCSTGMLSFCRNLLHYEIIEQFYHLKRLFGNISNIVYMGMGEPLDNISNVLNSISYFITEEKIAKRNITISTSGLAKEIKLLADKGFQSKLTLSLVSAIEQKRNNLMPISKINSLHDIKQALMYFQKKNKRRITFAYPMFSKINLTKDDALAIKKFSLGLVYHVNLIPYNQGSNKKFDEPTNNEISQFKRYLNDLSIPCSIRYSKGKKINGACGELALHRQEVDK